MSDAGKEPGAMTHQVFISYAIDNMNFITHDRQVADQICSALGRALKSCHWSVVICHWESLKVMSLVG